jgi:hypothetical protein
MRLENTIKYDLLIHQHSHHYVDVSKGSETVCFEVASRRNRFFNA